MRGVAQPLVVYRVLQESGAQGRLDAASTRGLTPLVGRESETTLLLERWAQAKEGQGQVILLSGEAGIGKSRLVQVLREHVADEPHIRLECRSSPYFANSALYPITDFLQRALRFQTDDTPETKLDKLEQNLCQYRLPLEESVPLFSALLSLPVLEDHYPPLILSPQRLRQKTLEAIVAIILELSERQPVLFILEDVHWTDPTTLEFIDLLIDQTPTTSICVLLTCRPEFQPPWSHRSYLTEITVNRLSRRQVEQMATQVASGKTLPTDVIGQLVDRTDGVPLYVEEMTKSVLESGVLKEADDQYELVGSITALSIPATLQDSLMARLDRLVTAKAIVQYASVIGRQFSYELLQAVSQLDESMLQYELGRLVEAELVYQRGLLPQATYTFKHALIQDIAYESLLRSTRQTYHQRLAQVLEEQFAETGELQPELLAHHYTEARLYEPALGYWRQAGVNAVQRSANAEAISHFDKGLELLKNFLPTTELMQQELDLQVALGAALTANKGIAAQDVERAYSRALELCQQMNESVRLLPVLSSLGVFYRARGDHRKSCEIGEQLLASTQSNPQPTDFLQAHYTLGASWFWRGELSLAREHLEQVMCLYQPQAHHLLVAPYGVDAKVHCLSYMALVLEFLGYPDQARQKSQEALGFAQELSHPHSLATALLIGSWFQCARRNVDATQEQSEAVIALSSEYEFPFWLTMGTTLRGWTLAMQGQIEEGRSQMHQGIVSHQATGAEQWRPCALTLLAEVYGKAGQSSEGLTTLKEALTLVDKNDERIYEAEIHRLKGALLLIQSSDHTAEAETSFHQAIAIAQNQSAKSWELRAATSLAKLWQSQSKVAEARDLLAPVYGWFTEGFDTADLIDAKALLDELTEGSP